MSFVTSSIRRAALLSNKRVFNSPSTRCMSSVYNLSDESAVEKFKSINDKSIMYFTATWCPPCKMIKPIYEKMASDVPEVAFAKIDVDDNAGAASKYEISGVPTFILFQKDEVFMRFTGADEAQLNKLVQDLKKSS